MIKIQFIGWKPGMRPIPFIHLLADLGEISLTDAKLIKENIVNDILVEIEIKDIAVANAIVSKSRELGIECDIKAQM